MPTPETIAVPSEGKHTKRPRVFTICLFAACCLLLHAQRMVGQNPSTPSKEYIRLNGRTVTFKPGFSGPKTIYENVWDSGFEAGWSQVGSWNVPAGYVGCYTDDDYATNQINCSLDYRLSPGPWTVIVRDANGVPSGGYNIWIN